MTRVELAVTIACTVGLGAFLIWWSAAVRCFECGGV